MKGRWPCVPDIILVVISGTAQARAAQESGCAHVAQEIFADRGYTEDGLLMDRRLPGAVIHDPGGGLRAYSCDAAGRGDYHGKGYASSRPD
jgi:lactam utilization protein B